MVDSGHGNRMLHIYTSGEISGSLFYLCGSSKAVKMATTMSWGSYLLIHVVIFSWYVFTLSANCSLKVTQGHPGAKTYGGRWKYLTFLNLVSVVGGYVMLEIVYTSALLYYPTSLFTLLWLRAK
jgi:hypothetical protein